MVQPNVCEVLVREECYTDLAMLVMEEGIFFQLRLIGLVCLALEGTTTLFNTTREPSRKRVLWIEDGLGQNLQKRLLLMASD